MPLKKDVFFCHAGRVCAVQLTKVGADVRIVVVVIVVVEPETASGRTTGQQHTTQIFSLFND